MSSSLEVEGCPNQGQSGEPEGLRVHKVNLLREESLVSCALGVSTL